MSLAMTPIDPMVQSSQIPKKSDFPKLCNLPKPAAEASPLWKRIAPVLQYGNLFVAGFVTLAAAGRLYNKKAVPLDEFCLDIAIHLYQAKVITEIVRGRL